MSHETPDWVLVRFALTREGILDGARKGRMNDVRNAAPGAVQTIEVGKGDPGFDDLVAIAEPDEGLVADYGARPRVVLIPSTRGRHLNYEWGQELIPDPVGSPPRVESRAAVTEWFNSHDVYNTPADAHMRIVEPFDRYPSNEEIAEWANTYRTTEAQLRADLQPQYESALREWRDNAFEKIANARRAVEGSLALLTAFKEKYGYVPLEQDSDLAAIPLHLQMQRDPQLEHLQLLEDPASRASEIRAAVIGALHECGALDAELETARHREALHEDAREWIESSGSSYLRRLLDHSNSNLTPHWNRYVDERLKEELPGWERARNALVSFEKAASPTQAAFDHLDEAREQVPDAQLAYGRVKDRSHGGGFVATARFCGETIYLPSATLVAAIDRYYEDAEEPF